MNKNIDFSIYWNIYITLSYNALFNFVVGNRSSGKTFGFKKWAIDDFLKTKAQFIYLRRYRTELDDIDTFFDDMRVFFPDVELLVKGKKFFINGELAGRAVALSTSSGKKGTPLPMVNKIGFDEFIITNVVYHYIRNEVELLLDYYSTVSRDRDCRIFFISNAITITNIYFKHFRIKLPTNKKLISCKNDVLIQLVQKKEFIDHMYDTRFGKLIKGSEYAKYSIENEFMLDNAIFVKKKTEAVKYFCTLVYLNKCIGAWIDRADGKIYMSYDYDPKYIIKYAITRNDHSPNTMLLSQLNKCLELKTIKDQFYLANVYFESIDIKNVMYEVIGILG